MDRERAARDDAHAATAGDAAGEDKKQSTAGGGFFSPRGMLKRGWSGVSSPLTTMKDSVYGASTPRSTSSSAATPTSHRALPSPAQYPSLFDVRRPSSTRSADDSSQGSSFNYAQAMPQSARASDSRSSSGSSRNGSWRTNSNSSRTNSITRAWPAPQQTDEMDDYESTEVQEEEERAYLSVCHHNLHSVLSKPNASSNWGGALLDALYPSMEADLVLTPFPGLPDVSTRDFKPYLRKYGANAAKYEENHVKPVSEQLSSRNVPSISVADEDVAKCLEVVPNMFFRSDFDFTDPNTFEEVMNMATSNSLQDELTASLDRVEFTLLRQVSSRSDRFFEASADQEVMKQSIKAACDQVATLRHTMDRLRNGLADKTLDIVTLHRRQKRMRELHEIMTMVESVTSAESAVEALVQCQDYTNALDLIDESQATLRDHLQGIHGLSALSEKFRGYHSFISKQISQHFISVVTSPEWMFREEDEGTSSYSMDAAERQRRDNMNREKDDLLVEVKRLVDILFRLDALNDTVRTYLDQLNEEIRVVVKTVVTETIAVSSSSKNSNDGAANPGNSFSGSESKVSIQLRALSSDEFLQCVQMIFEHLLMVLKRAVIVQNLLVKSMEAKVEEAAQEEERQKALCSRDPSDDTQDTKASSGGNSFTDSWSPVESATNEHKTLGDWKTKSRCKKVIHEIDEVVRKTCEFSQRSVSNLFAVRKEVQAVYTMPQLRKLYDTTMEFVVGIEKMTGKTDYTLRGALFSQLKLFLEKYHHAQVAKLVSTLDHELWKNSEISETRHRLLEDLSSGRGVALLLSDDREVAAEIAAPRKTVAICGKSFRVVWSVLLMLEVVMNYMSCAANFPVLATDVLQRSIEIFRLFNSRTTQLVLGAGAMQVARLKSISARHLALASQSLELSMTLIPHIKAALATHFTDRQKLLLDEFDRVLRDYAEHDERIFSKFTSIVEDQIMKRYLENVSAEVDYDSANLSIPTSAMRGITQSTLKLHAVLHPVLSAPQMKDVMSRVFDMFTQKLPDCFKHVQPKTPTGKKRVMEDIEVFVKSFQDVTVLDFDGGALLRHFRTAYDVS